MVYMIGSDLESEDGSATDDLLEMADAALSENVHLVLQTGGTETWWNDVCTDDESERFVIENGDMTLLQSLGSVNMTDADTLSDFIRFSAESYPADRYELILWDHGGGTMTGFGYDELYEDTSLTLSSLSTALYNGGVQFDFIGFDACLMATAEVAYALDPYADYLIAPEESEPGEGWAYKNWLTMLAEDPAVGHYEGVDERVLEEIVTDYVSIGDYVLTGGELPAMVMVDAISRLIPGVLHNDVSAEFESFQDDLLEYPQYSRPEEWHGKKVPPILLSGHHANIEKWRREQSIIRTKERRPDLLEKCMKSGVLDKKEMKFLQELLAKDEENT